MKSKLIKKIFILGSLLGSIALMGCTSNGNNEESKIENNNIVISHEMGETTLESEPKRIAVLELSFLDSLYNLDVDPVAIADDGQIQKVLDVTNGELTEYTSVGNRKEPSLEELSTLDLDLIIADTTRHSEIYEDLNKIAPTIVLDSINSSYDKYLENFETIAKVVGEEEKAEEKINEIENLLEEVKAKAENTLGDKKILTVSPKNDEYTAHTSSSFVGEILEKAGFHNAIQSENREASLSLEQLVELDPDIIVYIREDIDKTIYNEWKDSELYNSLKAVKDNNVYITASRGPWTQYRGIISVNKLTEEMTNWLLNN